MKDEMIKRSVPALAAVGLGLVFSASAWAQQQPTPTPQPMPNTPPAQQAAPMPGQDAGVPAFGDLDKNHDGRLSRSEIPKDVETLKPLRAHFREADLDGNGTLSEQEYVKYTAAYKSSDL